MISLADSNAPIRQQFHRDDDDEYYCGHYYDEEYRRIATENVTDNLIDSIIANLIKWAGNRHQVILQGFGILI